MLKELLSHRPIQVALLLVILIGISGLLYLNHVKTQTEGDVVNTETGVLKRDPPNPSAQDGHRHADGTWHAEPHPIAPEPVETPEPADTVSPFEVTEEMMARYRRFQEIAKTLPEDANVGDVVEASEFMPSEEEFRAMSSDELLSVIEKANEKVNEVFPEYQRRMERVINGADEPHEYIEVIQYEHAFRGGPRDLARRELDRRHYTHFNRLPPDQRFLTIHPEVAKKLKVLLEERYEKEMQEKESNR